MSLLNLFWDAKEICKEITRVEMSAPFQRIFLWEMR